MPDTKGTEFLFLRRHGMFRVTRKIILRVDDLERETLQQEDQHHHGQKHAPRTTEW